MSFLKRLGYFLIGLSIGIVFLTFFFKKKSDESGVSFCWLPNCRTLKDMRSKTIDFNDAVKSMVANNELDSLQIQEFLTNGNVDFSKSNTKTTPCKTYVIENEETGGTLFVKNCPEKLYIENFK